MRSFHERLTRLGLAAVAEHGFVLAGGYAISAHGLGNRLSADVDLFTNDADPETFATAVNDMRQALTDSGLTITDTTVSPLFVDINVSDSGAFTRTEVLEMADQQEAHPMDREMLAERFNSVAQYARDNFAEYGVGPSQQHAIGEFFANWAADLRNEESAEPLVGEHVAEAARAAGLSVDEYREVTARLTRTHPDSIPDPITGPQGAGESPRVHRARGTGAERGRGYERRTTTRRERP